MAIILLEYIKCKLYRVTTFWLFQFQTLLFQIEFIAVRVWIFLKNSRKLFPKLSFSRFLSEKLGLLIDDSRFNEVSLVTGTLFELCIVA